MTKRVKPWHVVAATVALAALVGCSGGEKKEAAPAGDSKPAAAAGDSKPAAAAGAVAGDPAKGKEVFMGTCSACHGPDAKGLPGSGKNLVNKSDWMKKQSDADLLAFVKKGRPSTDPVNTTGVDMPPKGGNPSLNDDDLKNVIAYIRSVQK